MDAWATVRPRRQRGPDQGPVPQGLQSASWGVGAARLCVESVCVCDVGVCAMSVCVCDVGVCAMSGCVRAMSVCVHVMSVCVHVSPRSKSHSQSNCARQVRSLRERGRVRQQEILHLHHRSAPSGLTALFSCTVVRDVSGVHEPRKGGPQFPGMVKDGDDETTKTKPSSEENPLKRKKIDEEERQVD